MGVEDLEGNFPIQLAILDSVDCGKATGANGLQDVVASDSLSCHPFPRSAGSEG